MKKLIFTLSAACVCSLAVAQQTPISRLVKKAEWNGTGTQVPGDSTYYIYKDTLSWDAVLLKWKCDTAITMRRGGSGFVNKLRISNKFDAQGRISEEITETYNLAGTIPSLFEMQVYTYTSQGKLATHESYTNERNSSNWLPTEKTINTYDAQGNVIGILRQEGFSGTLSDRQRSFITYNGVNQPDTTLILSMFGSFQQQDMRIINYYTGTRVSSTLYETFVFDFGSGIGSWVKSDSATNTYNAAGKLIEQEIKYNDSGTWVDATKYIYAYDASGNRVDSLFQTGAPVGGGPLGPLQDRAQKITTYNSYGQPLTEVHKAGSPLTAFKEIHFYYEPVNTGVTDKLVQSGSIEVYPVPAKNTLTVGLNWNEIQPATILLFDMTGKLAAQWTTPTAKQHTQTLDISNIPSGSYMLKVSGTKGVMSRQVNIVR